MEHFQHLQELLPSLTKAHFQYDYKLWDWTQLLKPFEFKWIPGITPLSNPGVLLQCWILYFLTIISLKIFMKNRPAFKLTKFTALHNLFLCFISLGMFVSGLIGGLQIYTTKGFTEVYCLRDSTNTKGLMYWSLYMYYLSKFPELIDTVILVLKKKPVIFLHWYHHSIVILLTWVWMEYRIGFGIFGLLLNTLVHVFMYWYYFCAGMGWKVWYKKYITTMQIVQFICLFGLAYLYPSRSKQNGCQGNEAFYLSVIINGSFLALFIQFYIKTYKRG